MDPKWNRVDIAVMGFTVGLAVATGWWCGSDSREYGQVMLVNSGIVVFWIIWRLVSCPKP